MSKDLSQYFQPVPKAEHARGQTTQILNFDDSPFTGESSSPKAENNDSAWKGDTNPTNLADAMDFLDGVDFDALEARNDSVANSGEELTDDGDCDGCKI